MKQLGPKDYWDGRAELWDGYAPPLIPSEPDLTFMSEQFVEGGDTLILGATPELCTLALGNQATVTAVDFSQKVIDKLRMDDVRYVCQDWISFLGKHDGQFDTIMTDGGLLGLEFPDSWQEIASLIHERLKPGGIFAARVYVTTNQPPLEQYENPNLMRFVTSMGAATRETNWMVHPTHPDYVKYDMEYAFPPREEVKKMFGQFVLTGELTPDYEEGARFPSFAWQRPA